jgi:tRNA A64-2'-O-ribosylphosphate transferase
VDGDVVCQNVLRISLPASVSAHSNFLLYNILPGAILFIGKRLFIGEDVCVACPTGKDLGPGVIVAALALFFGDNGVALCSNDVGTKGDSTRMVLVGSRLNLFPGPTVDKSAVRKRLQWIISSNPKVNPSRNTLKRVNTFLMSHHHPQYAPPSPTPTSQTIS